MQTTWRMRTVENVTLQVTTPDKPITRHEQVVYVIERALANAGLPLESVRSAAPTEEGTVETTETPVEETPVEEPTGDEPSSPPAEPPEGEPEGEPEGDA